MKNHKKKKNVKKESKMCGYDVTKQHILVRSFFRPKKKMWKQKNWFLLFIYKNAR